MGLMCVLAVLSALLFGFLKGNYEKEKTANSNQSKFPKEKSLWFEMAVVALTVIAFLSAMILTTTDTLKALEYDLSVWSILITLIISTTLNITLMTIGQEIAQPRQIFAKDYLRIGLTPTASRIINLTFLGVWISVTIAFFCFGITINALSLGLYLLISATICAVLGLISFLLVGIGYLICLLLKAIFKSH